MKYNLRAYRKLEQAINQWAIENPVSESVTVSVHSDNPAEVYNEAVLANAALFDTRTKLRTMRTAIRRFIQSENEAVGVNEVVGQRNHVLTEKAILEKLMDISSRGAYSAPTGELGAYLESRLAYTLKETDYGRKETFNIPIYDTDAVEEFKQDIISYNRQLRKLDDRLMELNNGEKKALLSEEDHELITLLGIV